MRISKSRGIALAAGLGLGLVWWVVAAEIEALLLDSGTLSERLLVVSSYDVASRLGVGILLVASAVIASEVASLTERRRSDEAESGLMDSLFALTKDPTVAIDREYRISVANREAARVSGRAEGDIIGARCYEVLCARSQPCDSCDVRQVFEDGVSRSAVVREARSDGDAWYEHTWTPLVGDGGRAEVVIETLADITRLKAFEGALESERDKSRTYVETTLTPMVAIDARGAVSMANPAASELLGLPDRWILGRDWYTEFMPPEDGTSLRRLFAPAIDGKIVLTPKGDSRVLSAQRGERLVSWNATLLHDPEGEIDGVLLSMDDVTERRVREHELMLRSFVLDNLQDSIILYRPDGTVLYANRAAWEPRGYTEEEFRQLPPFAWMPQESALSITGEEILHRITQGGEATFQSSIAKEDGSLLPLDVHARAVDIDGEQAILASGRDLSERIRNEEKFQRMAFYDELTGLANRALFLDRLRIALAQSARSGRPVAVLFLDLDHFKQVNDTLGHPVGDQVLQAVATRLAVNVRDGDTLARLGGDEFTFILPDIGGVENAERAAAKFLSEFREPFEIAGRTMRITASMGITVVTGSDVTVEEALARADAAMYRSKEDGRNGWRFYRDGMRASVSERFALRNRVRAGLDNQEFVLYFQPQVASLSGKVVGAEALVRWNHPDRGLLLPGEFLELVEEAGMMDALGQAVLREACVQGGIWNRAGGECFRVAVNISSRQLFGGTFVEHVRTILGETGLDPRCLQLEIAESSVNSELDYVAKVVDELRDVGASVAIDHFGTGFNSLERLRQLPVSAIKIDRSFTTDVEARPDAAAIANTVVSLAHNLEMEVIAEAVERPSQAAFLRDRGCDTFQGFLFSEPLPAVGMIDLLQVERRFAL